MGVTYSHLDKDLTNKYKSSEIIINDNVFFTGDLKNICDKNNPWKRYPEYYAKKTPYTIPIMYHSSDEEKYFKTIPPTQLYFIKHFNKNTSLLKLKITRIEYVTIYTGPDSCADIREYDIFAKDKDNNIYEISHLFNNLNTMTTANNITKKPHIKPKYQTFMTGNENDFKYAIFPLNLNLECKSGIKMKLKIK